MRLNARKIGTFVTAGLMVMGLGLGGAFAQQAESLGTDRSWTAWKSTDSNGVICYVASQPERALPSGVNRDPIYFLVIHRKGLGTSNEIQTIVGYPLEAGSTPTVTIDGRAFDMVVEGAAAWLTSACEEATFVAAMKAGTEMVVKGRSQRGTDTTDTYSLLGVTASLGKIDGACA